jgi:hypothetical protein
VVRILQPLKHVSRVTDLEHDVAYGTDLERDVARGTDLECDVTLNEYPKAPYSNGVNLGFLKI